MHPAQDSVDGHAEPPAGAGLAGARAPRPGADGGRHGQWQEHVAGVDDRVAQHAAVRTHPHHRGSDRIPVLQQAFHHQPARSGPRHGLAAHRPEERAAPGARLHHDRRDPRSRDDVDGDLVCAVRPPGARHPARQQQLAYPGPYPVLLHAGSAAGAAGRPGRGAEGHRVATPDALHRRRPRAGRRGAAQQPLHFRADRARRHHRRARGDGQVAGRRLADVRGGYRAPDRPGPGDAGRRPAGRRLAHQPAVAAAERHGAVSRVQAAKVESDAPSFTEITLDVLPEAPPTAPRQRLAGTEHLHRSKNG